MLSDGAGADALCLADHGVEEGARDCRPCRPPPTAVQVVAQLGQQRDNPWTAVEQETEHSEFGALGCDVCQCLLGFVGSARRAQGGHQQPVGPQQRAWAGLRLEPLHPGMGAVAGEAGLIGKQPANLGLIAQLRGDFTQSPVGERFRALVPPGDAATGRSSRIRSFST